VERTTTHLPLVCSSWAERLIVETPAVAGCHPISVGQACGITTRQVELHVLQLHIRNESMHHNFVRVVNGKVQLFLPPSGSPQCQFGSDAVSAIVQGDTVVVQCKNGRTQIWKINPSGRSVSGPVQTIR